MQNTKSPSPQKANGQLTRSLTDPEENVGQREKPKRSKICGKCELGLTGQFVRALGDTYHLECFTCHVCISGVEKSFNCAAADQF
jgi:hypothetical protein